MQRDFNEAARFERSNQEPLSFPEIILLKRSVLLIRKKIATFGLLALLPLATHAADLCSKVPGDWQGILTIKEPALCKQFNGCTHLVMADVTHVANNDYRVEIYPAVGRSGTVDIKCEGETIATTATTTETATDRKIAVSCNNKNHCFVTFDDSVLTSEMMKR